MDRFYCGDCIHSAVSGELNTVYRDWFLLAYLIGNSDNFFVKFLKLIEIIRMRNKSRQKSTLITKNKVVMIYIQTKTRETNRIVSNGIILKNIFTYQQKFCDVDQFCLKVSLLKIFSVI